jgi:hypothetical protein
MKNLVIQLLIIFFIAIAPSHSMQMLSIEQGSVFTEQFNIFHLSQASQSPKQTTFKFSTPKMCCHKHIILSNSYNLDNQLFDNQVDISQQLVFIPALSKSIFKQSKLASRIPILPYPNSQRYNFPVILQTSSLLI